jgi:hypothetical protein
VSAPTAKISIACMKTVLSEELSLKEFAKVRTHPVFQKEIEFGESRETKRFECPRCHKKVGYKAFIYEFNLRKAIKWPLITVGAGVMMFLTCFALFLAGWREDWVFLVTVVPGIAVGVNGLGWLVVQLLRHLLFYRKNKTRYVFMIRGFGHVLPDRTTGGKWKELKPQLP